MEAPITVIRVLCTDSLRLGSALSGLASSPEWLRRSATNAVRQSVTNLFDAAILARCQAVVVCGRVVEDARNLETALRWLKPYCQRLQDKNISLIIAGHSSADFSLLQQLPATSVVECHQPFLLKTMAGGLTVAAAEDESAAQGDCLLIRRSTADLDKFPSLLLRGGQVPTEQCEASEFTVEGQECPQLIVGCPQAISPAESGAHGGFVVDLTEDRTLSARFVATDSLRYHRDEVSFQDPVDRQELLLKLKQVGRSRAVSRRVHVADWIIHGTLICGETTQQSLEESRLLQDLRESLQGGLAGFWPRRIQLADNCELHCSEPNLQVFLQDLMNNPPDGDSVDRIGVLQELLGAVQRAA